MVAFVDLCQDATEGTLSHLWILLLDIGVYMFEFTMKRPPVQKGVCELLGCVSWHVRPFSSVVTQRIESYWMRKHYKRCVSVCVCLCMHRYPKHRSSNSGPLNPLVKDCPNLPIFASHMSHQNVHLMSDMSWSCDINRSHCPVMSSFSLIAVCRLRRQSESRKSAQQPVPSKDMLEKPRIGRFCLRPLVLRCQSKCLPTLCGGIWGAWLLCFEAVLSYQATTGVILMFLIEMRWLKHVLTLWKNAWWKSYLPTLKQWSDTKLLGRPAWQEYEGVPDFARLCPFKQSAFISFENEEWWDHGMCFLAGNIDDPSLWLVKSPFCLANSTTSGSTLDVLRSKSPFLLANSPVEWFKSSMIGHACSSGGHAWSKWRISGAICVGTLWGPCGDPEAHWEILHDLCRVVTCGNLW